MGKRLRVSFLALVAPPKREATCTGGRYLEHRAHGFSIAHAHAFSHRRWAGSLGVGKDGNVEEKVSEFAAYSSRHSEGGRVRDTNSESLSLQHIHSRQNHLSSSLSVCVFVRFSQWLYVVGSTNDGTTCRLLKIDRSPPNPAHPHLNVVDTDMEYSEREMKEVCVCACVRVRVFVCVNV